MPRPIPAQLCRVFALGCKRSAAQPVMAVSDVERPLRLSSNNLLMRNDLPVPPGPVRKMDLPLCIASNAATCPLFIAWDLFKVKKEGSTFIGGTCSNYKRWFNFYRWNFYGES